MLRFLRSHIHHTGDFKPDDVHDYFNYAPTLRHGFPQNVSALAHDYLLGLMAVGTSDGQIRVFGAENVEWCTTTPKNIGISHMYFAAGVGVLLILCSDQSFHKIQLNGDKIERTTANHEERMKRITCCEMQNADDPSETRLLIGTVTGNIFALYVATLELSELVLFEDNISKNIPALKEDVRSVDEIAVNPKDSSKMIIAFNNLAIVYYDIAKSEVIRYWRAQQPITSISLYVDGEQFICSHVDGSLDMFACDKNDPLEPANIPFGPFPCMSISKVIWACAASHPWPTKFFSGGMPRASYGDRYTLSVMHQAKHVVFDFGSPVVDFFLVPSLTSRKADYSKSIALMVLCEQELVCVDLSDSSWPTLSLPYLQPIHSSQITCNIHCSNIAEHVWKILVKASEGQKKKGSIKKNWPITAGSKFQPHATCAASNSEKRQLLITGHENGMVKFWSTGSASLRYMLTVETAKEFEGCFPDEDEEQEPKNQLESDDELNGSSEWPPFRKVGIYDPFCDDPRLAVQKLHFDPNSGQLVVGGRAGHVVTYNLEDEPTSVASVERITFEIVGSSKTSTHISQQHPLPPRRSPLAFPIGYQSLKTENSQNFVMQLKPAVPVTALSSLQSRNILAIGCEYGFVVCDLKTQQPLIRNCLISSEDLTEVTAMNGALSRFKSMKKSIRQSFRRKKKSPQADASHSCEPGCSTSQEVAHEVRPVERQIAARTEIPVNVGDPLPSTVRILKFYDANILSSTSGTESLWVGTNSGLVLVYAIADDALKPEDVCILVKEIHLQHRAPVIDFDYIVLDSSSLVKGSLSNQRVMILTEEQIKTFALPAMKSTRFKYKLTGIEGSRLRKAQVLTLRSNTNRKMFERLLAVVTNQGELFLFSAVGLKRLLKIQFTKATDIAGIASAVLSTHGEIFFLRPGGSEFQRATLAAVQHSNLFSPLKDQEFPPKPSL